MFKATYKFHNKSHKSITYRQKIIFTEVVKEKLNLNTLRQNQTPCF